MPPEPTLETAPADAAHVPSEPAAPAPAATAAPAADAAAAVFPSLPASSAKSAPLVQGLEQIFDVSVALSVELGRTTLPIREILRFQAGSVVRLDNAPGDPVDVRLNGKLMARGEVIVQDEHFAIRITELISADK